MVMEAVTFCSSELVPATLKTTSLVERVYVNWRSWISISESALQEDRPLVLRVPPARPSEGKEPSANKAAWAKRVNRMFDGSCDTQFDSRHDHKLGEKEGEETEVDAAICVR